jgi:hypothetical protein
VSSEIACLLPRNLLSSGPGGREEFHACGRKKTSNKKWWLILFIDCRELILNHLQRMSLARYLMNDIFGIQSKFI